LLDQAFVAAAFGAFLWLASAFLGCPALFTFKYRHDATSCFVLIVSGGKRCFPAVVCLELPRIVPWIAPPAVSGDKFLAWVLQVHYSFLKAPAALLSGFFRFLLAPPL
jgi:hypothetical protein